MHSGFFRSVPAVALIAVTRVACAANAYDVDCSQGKSIADALAKAGPGDVINIAGTCRERVIVATDRITLNGEGTAVIDGGGAGGGSFAAVIAIRGARGVVIRGLDVQHGPNGIGAAGGAAFEVSDSVFQNHAGSGILIIGGSTGELTNCSMLKNGAGMNVLTGSTVILRGAIAANGNAGVGLSIGGSSMLEIRGAAVQANNNGVNGVSVSGAQGAIWAFSESQKSSLTASGNGFAGIGIAEGNFQSGGGSGPNVINAVNNGVYGLFLPIGGALDIPFGAVQVAASGNRVGVYLGMGSRVLAHGGLTVQNNETGVLADGGDVLNVNASAAPIPPAPSSITANGVDVDLRFGSRAIFGNELTLGTMKCDKTVLSRGSVACP
jgi:hypothetical protein